MNRKQLFGTCATLTLLSGAALGAGASAYPDCLASPQEQSIQSIASSMIRSLPVEQQRIIAEKGGIGSEDLDLSGFARRTEKHTNSRIASGMTAHEYLELLLSDDIKAALTEQQLQVVTSMASLMDEGKEMPFMCFAPDADPAYAYLIDELLDYQFVSDETGERFQQGNRWSRTATDGSGLQQGDPTVLTYSFPPDGSFIPNTGLGSGTSTLHAWLNGRYGNEATWQAIFAQVFDRWADLTGISYVYEPNDDGDTMSTSAGVLGVRGDVRIFAFNYPFDGNGGVLAYNFFPNDGDMAIDAYDNFYNVTSGNSIRLRNVVAHEHGHGLGMEHVCPANGTKLMEPFISTSYDGPQLDDILNGQRFYGDPLEPNNSLANATDLGTFGDSGFVNINDVSIDDNSDTDFFHLELTDRARINFLITPNAAQYTQGPQTQSCNSGSSVNYNTINDLQIQLYSYDDLFTPVMTVNETGAGSGETLVYEAQSAGEYLILVSSATNTNNIQRYLASMVLSSLPPVVCPADITGDGELNFFDVSAFLSAFGSQQPQADFDDNGQYNFFDVSAFLSAFGEGCP